jgi:hypothetical protein
MAAALRVATRSVVIAPSLQGSEADIVAPLELGPGGRQRLDRTGCSVRASARLAGLGRVPALS